MGYAQAIVPEDAAPPGFLRHPMLRLVAPGLDRVLIAPEGEGQDLAFLGERLEPLDGKEAVHLFQNRPQLGGDVQIGVAIRRPDFENHGDYRVTFLRNSRLSRRINLCRCAKAKLAFAPSCSLSLAR